LVTSNFGRIFTLLKIGHPLVMKKSGNEDSCSLSQRTLNRNP